MLDVVVDAQLALVDVLDDVLGVGDRAEQVVGEREDQPPMAQKRVGGIGHSFTLAAGPAGQRYVPGRRAS